jgi:hypothetical protein
LKRISFKDAKDTLTSSAKTKYAIVCPSAMRVIQVVSNAAGTHGWVQTELPANRRLSAYVGGKASRTLASDLKTLRF